MSQGGGCIIVLHNFRGCLGDIIMQLQKLFHNPTATFIFRLIFWNWKDLYKGLSTFEEFSCEFLGWAVILRLNISIFIRSLDTYINFLYKGSAEYPYFEFMACMILKVLFHTLGLQWSRFQIREEVSMILIEDIYTDIIRRLGYKLL